MKSKPDDRRDNVQKIQRNIRNTVENMDLAEDMIERTRNEKTKRELEEKNDKRRASLDSMRGEVKDEAKYRKQF